MIAVLGGLADVERDLLVATLGASCNGCWFEDLVELDDYVRPVA